jgi:small subunit ribosomal protein S16
MHDLLQRHNEPGIAIFFAYSRDSVHPRQMVLEIFSEERGEVMSVRIRLKRMGTHKKPYYRLVVADSRSPRDGRFIEMVGTYDPLKKPAEIKVDQAKALDWLKKGAVPSDTVKTLLSKVGVMKQHAEAK